MNYIDSSLIYTSKAPPLAVKASLFINCVLIILDSFTTFIIAKAPPYAAIFYLKIELYILNYIFSNKIAPPILFYYEF